MRSMTPVKRPTACWPVERSVHMKNLGAVLLYILLVAAYGISALIRRIKGEKA